MYCLTLLKSSIRQKKYLRVFYLYILIYKGRSRTLYFACTTSLATATFHNCHLSILMKRGPYLYIRIRNHAFIYAFNNLNRMYVRVCVCIWFESCWWEKFKCAYKALCHNTIQYTFVINPFRLYNVCPNCNVILSVKS